ncbi:MAG: ABC transporter substrate-binding protein [Chloroflexi bacterium]|nr:ABC transporter substrate-binding protein [Chloroflexota bacterium]MCL5074063.1 ABC transporter substrate-binding protein [Chloroflexota bacterium]
MEKIPRRRRVQKEVKMSAWAKRLGILIVMMLVAIGTTVASCLPAAEAPTVTPTKGPPVGVPRPGGTLIFAVDAVADSLEPATWQAWGNMLASDLLFDTLVQSREEGKITPGLAESWEISPDGLVYTFHLRRNVKFHDGSPFTAEAVKISFERQYMKDHRYNTPMLFQSDQFLWAIKEIKVLDDYTVQLVRKEPSGGQLRQLTHMAASIVNPVTLEKYGKDEAPRHPIGTGPFVFEAFRPNELAMKANPDYWGGRPYLDRVIIRAIADDASRVAALAAGEVDATIFLPADFYKQVQQNPKLRLQFGASLSVTYLGFNCKDPVLSNQKLRQALSYAVNRKNVIDVIYAGQAVPALGFIPPAIFGYDPNLKSYAYDPKKAKELLAEAGYPGGLELTLTSQSEIHWPKLAQLIQSDLAAIGVKVNIETLDSSAFWGKVGANKHQMFINDWAGIYRDPYGYIVPNFTSGAARAKQRFGYGSPDVLDPMVWNAVREADPDKALKLWTAVQERLLLDAPAAFLVYYPVPIVTNARVQNFSTYGAAGKRLYLDKVWLEK